MNQHLRACKYQIDLKPHKLEVLIGLPTNTRLQLAFKIGSQRVESKTKFKFIHRESVLFETLSLITTCYLHRDQQKLIQKKKAEIEIIFINSNVQNKAGTITLSLENFISQNFLETQEICNLDKNSAYQGKLNFTISTSFIEYLNGVQEVSCNSQIDNQDTKSREQNIDENFEQERFENKRRDLQLISFNTPTGRNSYTEKNRIKSKSPIQRRNLKDLDKKPNQGNFFTKSPQNIKNGNFLKKCRYKKYKVNKAMKFNNKYKNSRKVQLIQKIIRIIIKKKFKKTLILQFNKNNSTKKQIKILLMSYKIKQNKIIFR